MTMNRFKALLFAACALFATAGSRAEDTDLFHNVTSSSTSLPNVLIVLDNTANWNTAFTSEMSAMSAVLSSLTSGQFRVGIMMYTETGGSDSGPGGAYVRAAVRTLTDDTVDPVTHATVPGTKTKYTALVNSFDKGADKGNGRGLALSMAEAYQYFAAKTSYAGSTKYKRDYNGNVVTTGSNFTAAGVTASNAIYALSGNAFTSNTGTTYVSPVTTDTCHNFIIYIGNTTSTGNVTSDNNSDNSTAGTLLAGYGGNTTTIQINPSGAQDNYADEWSRFMKSSSQAITTFTVDVSYGTNGGGPANSALLQSMASQGGGSYFRINASGASDADLTAAIKKALGDIFSQIQSVNTAFASVSLPVSVNTQGTYLNQVFIGMFRPDSAAAPRWAGNLKQYKLAKNTAGTDLQLVDADGTSAINTSTGFISECVRSFWTPSTTDTYWSFKSWPTGTSFCLTNTAYTSSNYPDGNIVEKGGQAYKLRSTTTRNVFTCDFNISSSNGGTPCSSLKAFNTTNVTATALGNASMGSTMQTAMVNWAKGLDAKVDSSGTTFDENSNGITTGEMRPSAHGDVVHSRPVAVNFGSATESASNVVVFYGGNDGWLRAINGNRGDTVNNTSIGTYEPGRELWAFMPPEFQSKIQRIYDNTTLVQYKGETYASGVTTSSKDYGIDGPITSFTGTVGGVANKTLIFATMRRGGRSIYSFDVSNSITSPGNPSLKWRIGCSDATTTTDCSTNMSGIGQTWGSVKSMTTAGYGSGASPLLIFGGGYDTCEDSDPNTCTSSSNKGHYVYVVRADTGAVVKKFDTQDISTSLFRGIIADITLVKDSSGNAILGYTADLGGNVYRIQFGSGTASSDNSSTWTMTRVASLGCSDGTVSCTANRKFMFAPSVVTTDTISLNATYYLMLGSGDREKPVKEYTSSYGVTNYFFQIIDKPGVSGYPSASASCSNLAVLCLASLYGPITGTSPSTDQLASYSGWYLGLATHEQVVTSAVTIFGVTTFSTHTPSDGTASACSSNLGTTLVYNVGFTNASAVSTSRYAEVSGDGLPPSPVAGQVTLDDGSTVPFCVGCSSGSPLQAKLPTSLTSATQAKGRLYWYLQK